MTDLIKKLKEENEWVWVVIQNPGGNAQFLGLTDGETGESFIPVFLDKESCSQGMVQMPGSGQEKFEAQAIRYNDLAARAAENGFGVFILQASGEVLAKDTAEKA